MNFQNHLISISPCELYRYGEFDFSIESDLLFRFKKHFVVISLHNFACSDLYEETHSEYKNAIISDGIHKWKLDSECENDSVLESVSCNLGVSATNLLRFCFAATRKCVAMN